MCVAIILRAQVSEDDKETVANAVKEALEWMDDNQEAGANRDAAAACLLACLRACKCARVHVHVHVTGLRRSLTSACMCNFTAAAQKVPEGALGGIRCAMLISISRIPTQIPCSTEYLSKPNKITANHACVRDAENGILLKGVSSLLLDGVSRPQPLA